MSGSDISGRSITPPTSKLQKRTPERKSKLESFPDAREKIKSIDFNTFAVDPQHQLLKKNVVAPQYVPPTSRREDSNRLLQLNTGKAVGRQLDFDRDLDDRTHAGVRDSDQTPKMYKHLAVYSPSPSNKIGSDSDKGQRGLRELHTEPSPIREQLVECFSTLFSEKTPETVAERSKVTTPRDGPFSDEFETPVRSQGTLGRIGATYVKAQPILFKDSPSKRGGVDIRKTRHRQILKDITNEEKRNAEAKSPTLDDISSALSGLKRNTSCPNNNKSDCRSSAVMSSDTLEKESSKTPRTKVLRSPRKTLTEGGRLDFKMRSDLRVADNKDGLSSHRRGRGNPRQDDGEAHSSASISESKGRCVTRGHKRRASSRSEKTMHIEEQLMFTIMKNRKMVQQKQLKAKLS
mmetsp:Transcript_26049/g.29825  ORF Transcript_26049/g.29825 Transcript_26049/m.29825 type:complete len:405 (-) Transcript_26049:2-1216(-)